MADAFTMARAVSSMAGSVRSLSMPFSSSRRVMMSSAALTSSGESILGMWTASGLAGIISPRSRSKKGVPAVNPHHPLHGAEIQSLEGMLHQFRAASFSVMEMESSRRREDSIRAVDGAVLDHAGLFPGMYSSDRRGRPSIRFMMRTSSSSGANRPGRRRRGR